MDSLTSAYLQHGSGVSFDNAGNLWAATEVVDVAMYPAAQLASGNISTPARTLTAAAGERTFGLGFSRPGIVRRW